MPHRQNRRKHIEARTAEVSLGTGVTVPENLTWAKFDELTREFRAGRNDNTDEWYVVMHPALWESAYNGSPYVIATAP